MYAAVKKRGADCRGFTAVELLAVVALLIILMSLAMPSLMESWRGMRITELDGTAREIFLSAQNELTDMKASDRLAALPKSGGLAREVAAAGGAVKLRYYITNDQLSSAFGPSSGPVGLLGTLPGKCVIYLDPYSGDVTDVYFAKGELSYEEVKSLRDLLDGHDDRTLRSARGIGYYGGLTQTSPTPLPEETPHQREALSLVNGEDLYMTLTYPSVGEEAFSNPQKILAEITLADEHGKTVVVRADGRRALENRLSPAVFASVGTDQTYYLQVLFDSLVPDLSFSTLYPELTAGDDLTVTVSLFYNGKALYRGAPVGTQNSLFSAKYAGDVTQNGVTHRKGIEFSYARHLSNLRYLRQNAAAVQVADIDFDPAVRRSTMLPVAPHLDAAPTLFLPINLSDSSVSGLTVDGQIGSAKPFSLRHFAVNSETAGIFGRITVPAVLQNLRMVDCSVTGRDAAGTLAGSVQPSGAVTVRNCGVYQSAYGKGAVTGAAAPTGGLVGQTAGSVSLISSFAAVPVTGRAGPVGGLVGAAGSGAVFENCYASGAVTAASAAGGLLGRAAGTVTARNVFSSSSVKGTGAVGGLVGEAAGTLSLSHAYACGIVTAGGAATYGPVAGSAGATFFNVGYLSQSGDPNGVKDAYQNSRPVGVSPYEYDTLASGTHNSPQKCHPYQPSLVGKAYPFWLVTDEYYGDWPARFEPPKPSSGTAYGLSYFEEYDDGSWGFYSYDKDGKLLDSLNYDNTKKIVRTGYGVAVAVGTENVKPPRLGSNWGEATLGAKISIGQGVMDLYPINDAGAQLATYFGQRSVQIIDAQSNNRLIYVNPYFAAALSLTDILANEKTPVQIRTEEQLATRSVIKDSWYFKQTHDIVLENKTFIARSRNGETVPVYAGDLNNNAWGTVYDGNGNTIYNCARPLFSINNSGAVIKNVKLSSVSIRDTQSGFDINSDPGIAALVTYNNQGLIDNCHVLSGTVSSSNRNAAGLVGRNHGTITNSSAAADVISENGGAAGFVAINFWNSSIQGSKAAGTVTALGTDQAATGFVLHNEGGRISTSSAAGAVSAPAGYASGFVDANDQGHITDWQGYANVSGRYTYPFVHTRSPWNDSITPVPPT